MRNGFRVTHHVCKETGIGNTWLAEEARGVIEPNKVTLPPDEHATWGPGHSDETQTHRFVTESSRVTLDDDPRWSTLRLDFVNFLSDELAADVSVGESAGRVSVTAGGTATLTLALPAGLREVCIASELSTSPGSDERLGLAVRRIELMA
jgi:hypothetical protein